MRRAMLTVATGLAVVLAGCSADGVESSADAPMSEEAADADADVDAGGAMEDGASEGDAGGSTGADGVVTFGGSGSSVVGRQLARTASIILEVEDVEQAASRVAAAAQRAGGFVSGADVRGGEFGHGSLTLRVPAGRLDATIEDLATVGLRVVESSISTEDLTDQLTDLGARIANLERLEAELQLLLADVRDGDPQASQLLTVFERINQVRGDIERLQAQQAGARDRVALATVHVELVPTSIAPEAVEPAPDTTLGRAWQSTRDAFGAIGDALIWLVVTVLPVTLVVLGIPAVLLHLALRAINRHRRERDAAARAAHGAPTPTAPTPPTPRQDPSPASDAGDASD